MTITSEVREGPVPRYGRWERHFDRAGRVDRVEFGGPDGAVTTRPVFLHQPGELVYDEHGYEAVEARGEPVTAVRYTPVQVGEHRYRALAGGEVVEEGMFRCEESGHGGYVEVSARGPRYFALSDGEPYCAIGLNLCTPPGYPLPGGSEHFAVSGRSATLGCKDYERWFRRLSEHGGNFTRLWLSSSYFEAQGEVAGQVDPLAFARLDRVVDLARAYGIRLKVCLEHFRTLEPGTFFSKVLRHPEDGRSPASMDEWFESAVWRDLWMRRVGAYLARYGDDPVIMAWELWNEINCCATRDWSVQREWTRRTLPEIKRRSPRNLVVNSIGSFDDEAYQRWYDDFKMEEMDFQQVHRYLDQGARMELCRHDPVAFSVDAIRRSRRPDRPVILAETGGVNDVHTGPFRFYRYDDTGIIFQDTTFPAFFAGSAGTGQIWHWNEYVDFKNLWRMFRPFADMVAGVRLDEEGFEPVDLSTARVWFLALCGRRHCLALVRSKADSWYAVLRDGQEPPPVRGQRIDLRPLAVRSGEVSTYRPVPDGRGRPTLAEGVLRLPAFRHGMLLKIRRA